MSNLLKYPCKIYISLLLDEKNNITGYKVGTTYWKSTVQASLQLRNLKLINKHKIANDYWEVSNSEEHQRVFEELSREYIRLWRNFKCY